MLMNVTYTSCGIICWEFCFLLLRDVGELGADAEVPWRCQKLRGYCKCTWTLSRAAVPSMQAVSGETQRSSTVGRLYIGVGGSAKLFPVLNGHVLVA